MKKCSKRTYISERLAVDALLEARIRFDQNNSVTVYQCMDCGEWHLTSKGTMHDELKRVIENGSLNKNKQAFHWQKKLGY